MLRHRQHFGLVLGALVRRISVVTTPELRKQRTVKLSGVTSEAVHQRWQVDLDFL